MGKALKNPGVVVGGGLVVLWLAVAVFAPLIAPYDPLHSIKALAFPGETGPHGEIFWLGTDFLGRDILSRLLYGSRPVVILSTLATLTAYVVGTTGGLIAGYLQGRVDTALSFLANVILSFPVLVLYIVVIVALGASTGNIIIAVTFGSAPAIYRIVRALTIDLRSRDFVAAALTQGETTRRILMAEILPNVTGPLAVDFCLRLGYTAITIS
jgi:ABC-type dipeptide/oligopeptide/nickel transport system permease subunit